MYILFEDDTNSIILDENHPFCLHKAMNFYYDSGGFLSLEEGYRFKDGSRKKRLEYRCYEIVRIETIKIFVYENIDPDDYHMYRDSDFIMSKDQRSGIITHDLYLAKHYLYYHERHIRTSWPNLLLNGRKYDNEELKDGDEITMLSFRMKIRNGFLYISSYLNDNRLQKYIPEPKEFRFRKKEIPKREICIANKEELLLPDIREFKVPQYPKQRNILLQMGPAVTMSTAMVAVSAINSYNSYLDTGDATKAVVYLLMPVTMMISALVWPLLTRISENASYRKEYRKEKEKYLEYLKKEDAVIRGLLSSYLKKRKELCFPGITEKHIQIPRSSPIF